MPTSWERAIAFVLEQEGGYTLDPNDPGGETNFGISKKAYPTLDIKALTVDAAKEIYKRDYWNPCRCDNLPFPIALSVFDMAVNQGVGGAIKVMQETFGVPADGVIGPVTMAAIKAGGDDPRKFKLFLARRLTAYARLMAANQNLLVFSRNWSFRVISLAETVFKS
jgi:lysozyme family protein